MTKIALAHDSFTQSGGAERVIESFHELFPEAPIYTTVVDKYYAGNLYGWKIITSPLQYVYNIYNHFQYLFPLIPIALKFVSIPRGYTIFLSSSSSFAKAIKKPQGSIHINYCHTPSRFIWTDVAHAVSETPVPLRPFTKIYLKWMKRWDLRAVKNVDVFIANSREVQKRIKEFYNRDSTVLFPFVDTNRWKPTREKKDYFLLAGRLQAHKQNDVVIKIFNELGLPLHVVGTGRQEGYLKSIAKSNIIFLGRVSDDELIAEYSGARGYIYPQLEDAGLGPLEAAACGTPTIALGAGGSLEVVIPGITGELFTPNDFEQLKGLIKNWDTNKYSINRLREHANKFNKQRFQEGIKNIISQHSITKPV